MYRLAAALLVGLFVLAPTATLNAGKFNKVQDIGNAAPTWSGLEGVDGKKHSLSDLKDAKVVVMVITCNHCPMAVAYEDRIVALTKKWQGKGVEVVAINVNNGDADKLAAMKVRARLKKFNFPYLYDPSQKVGQAYGASRTPEFFVINRDRKIAYMGALDDNEEADMARRNYVDQAIQAALAGKRPSVTETAARGCGVQYDE